VTEVGALVLGVFDEELFVCVCVCVCVFSGFQIRVIVLLVCQLSCVATW
jgi:hypothetical protein